jgi:hypothetical protein
MSLHDGDIAELAREAVDHKDPRLEVRNDPLGQNDPYRLGAEAWTVTAGGRSSYVTSSMTWREALDKLTADLAR